MTDAKPAPSPWSVEVTTTSDGVAIAVYDALGRRITDWLPERATAHLISAAPEMLAALRDANPIWNQKQITVAIAKAEGRTP